MILFGLIVALIALIIASLTDLKSREVPDYVSYGLMFASFGIAITHSIISWDYSYIAQSTIGFAIGMGIAYAMFYLGQWGGGDSKLLMGLGGIIGFNVFAIFGQTNLWLLIMLANIIFFGALYGLAWSIYLAIKNRKIFMQSLKLWLNKKPIIITRRLVLGAVIIMMIAALTVVPRNYIIPLLSCILLFYFVFYIWLFVKIIEESCMIKQLPIGKLTEGDWIYKDVIIDGKKIVGPKDLGISIEQIETLKKYHAKKKINAVTVKEGIPFIPAFLIAYIAMIIMYYFRLLPF